MTRLDALRALYDAVKVGTATANDFRAAFPSAPHEQHTSVKAWRAGKAYDGSVDAALAFIAGTLPGFSYEIQSGPLCYARIGFHHDYAAHPATALLLAALAAHIAQEEGK